MYAGLGVRNHFVVKSCKNKIFYFNIKLLINIVWARQILITERRVCKHLFLFWGYVPSFKLFSHYWEFSLE